MMNMLKVLIAVALLLVAGVARALDNEPSGRYEVAPKYAFPRYPGALTPRCPAGQADKWEMVCDPGSRAPIDETFQMRVPGVSLCRARWVGCGEIRGYVPRTTYDAMEVRDAFNGDELVSVTFGLERLLGEAPFK
jgi:hypothetical protein